MHHFADIFRVVGWGAAIQLHQVNSGMKGKPLGSGGIVIESEGAIKQEWHDAIIHVRGPAYKNMKRSIVEINAKIRASLEHGKSKEALGALVERCLRV